MGRDGNRPPYVVGVRWVPYKQPLAGTHPLRPQQTAAWQGAAVPAAAPSLPRPQLCQTSPTRRRDDSPGGICDPPRPLQLCTTCASNATTPVIRLAVRLKLAKNQPIGRISSNRAAIHAIIVSDRTTRSDALHSARDVAHDTHISRSSGFIATIVRLFPQFTDVTGPVANRSQSRPNTCKEREHSVYGGNLGRRHTNALALAQGAGPCTSATAPSRTGQQ